MKPLTEIRIRLCGICCMILYTIFLDLYPSGSGLGGLFNFLIICLMGFLLGCYITNFLIAFKKWWKE